MFNVAKIRGYKLGGLGLVVLSSLVALYGADSGCSRSGAQAPDKHVSGQAAKVLEAPASPVAIDDANKLSDVFATIAARVSRSVVSIRIESKQPRQRSPFDFFFGNPFGDGQQGQGQGNGEQDYNIVRGGGSGVLLTADGYVLTNNHVVKEATRIEVVLKDKRRFIGKVVGTDAATDLAVVKIDAKDLPAARLADSNKARVGEWVLAIGSPFGLDYTVTAGVLSAMGRGGLGANEIEDYLQTDASINPGNSGGPLVNLRGEVLGINTMIIGRGTGIGFAIPSNIARSVSDQLRSKGKVSRAWIGVLFQELTPDLAKRFGVAENGGALVSQIVPNAPAAKAGLQAGDVITKVDSTPVREGRDLLRVVIAKPVGSTLTLEILRNGKAMTKKLTTAGRPDDVSKIGHAESNAPGESNMSAKDVGLELDKLTPQIAQQLGVKVREGVVITAVRNGSAAERAGLTRGDVIVEADRKGVRAPGEVVEALKDGSALLRVERQDGAFYTVLNKDSN